MKLLDLYCCAGGAAKGYEQAGFTEIVGVDIIRHKNYPYRFILGDAIEVGERLLESEHFDAIHASPPCQKYSVNTKQHGTMDNHPDLIEPTRLLLVMSGKPYVIENVVGAPLENPITLCGSMFGSRQLRRHRLFESNVNLIQPECNHAIQGRCISVAGHAGGSSRRDGAERFGGTAVWKELMGIDWMTGAELAEAIPPMYTKYVGQQLIEAIHNGQ